MQYFWAARDILGVGVELLIHRRRCLASASSVAEGTSGELAENKQELETVLVLVIVPAPKAYRTRVLVLAVVLIASA